MDQLLAYGAGAIIGGIVVFFLLTSLFLFLGAAIAGVRGRSFGKAMLSALLILIVNFIIMLLLSFIPIVGQIIGIIACFFIDAALVKGIFRTSYGKGLLTILMYFVITIVIGLIVGAIIGFGSFQLLEGLEGYEF
jgi:hypothetical protein